MTASGEGKMNAVCSLPSNSSSHPERHFISLSVLAGGEGRALGKCFGETIGVTFQTILDFS